MYKQGPSMKNLKKNTEKTKTLNYTNPDSNLLKGPSPFLSSFYFSFTLYGLFGTGEYLSWQHVVVALEMIWQTWV
jgi:hypothetical protein